MINLILKRLSSQKYISAWIILLLDVALSTFSTLLVILLCLTQNISLDVSTIFVVCVLSSFSSLVSFYLFRTYRNVIRHFSLRDVGAICMASILKTLLLFSILKFLEILTPTFVSIRMVLDCMLTIVLLFAVRAFMAFVYDIVRNKVKNQHKRVLIYGIDNQSIALYAANWTCQEYDIYGFCVYGDKYKSIKIQGKRVFDFINESDFKNLITLYAIDAIFFPNEEAAQTEKNRLISYCLKQKLNIYISHPIHELEAGKIPRQHIREVRIEDILGRDEISINMKEIRAQFKQKTIFVTGAAGSIGSELCRQLATFDVKQLILYDSAETPMHYLRLELEKSFPELNFIPVIGDVRLKNRLAHFFEAYRPDIVFHAAAYKHVPLMEENPCEAILTNLIGTSYVAELCVTYRVEKMVMVSTDKAVNPTNVMGASKRLAEMYVQSLGQAIQQEIVPGITRFITTRFGNVIGSNGSVIPLFAQQISKGGPVTVTHPDIMRYFMTIPEASKLVMEAATIGKGNDIYVFDMGKPVKIAQIAKRMIELAGYIPDQDIKIQYTGLRPGEKLHEELLSDQENTLPTRNCKIRIAKVRPCEYASIVQEVSQLRKYALEINIPETIKLMKQIIPEYISNNSRFETYDKLLTPLKKAPQKNESMSESAVKGVA